MPKQFWNSEKTDDSLRTLRSLSGKVDFVLIGGWAVYFYVRTQKSEDINIAIDYDNINFFRQFGIKDYKGISIKYTEMDRSVVDLFLQGHADRDLPIPVDRILKDYVVVEGIKVVKKELLLLLKLWGYFRSDELKLKKDIIDVLCLLFYSRIDLNTFKSYIDEYKIGRRRSWDVLLEYLDKGRLLSDFIAADEKEYDKLSSRFKSNIRRALDH